MSQNKPIVTPIPSAWSTRLYTGLLFFLVVTGFGQMPIFKRYYVADIPGLGWLAQFYTTHFLHYLGGTLVLALIGYLVTDWMTHRSPKRHLTPWGWYRLILLAGILLTGLLLALKNFSGYWYPPVLIVFLDLIHLGLVMVWLVSGLANLFIKKRWI